VSEQVEVLARRLDADLPLPRRSHPGDAGLDLRAAHDAVIPPRGGRVTVATGLALALPDGYVALVHPRSGLAARHGVTVLNAPGTVDAGYRGEIRVTLLNTDPTEPFALRRGDRIAQLVFQRFASARLVEVERLPGSTRGEGGFGSTGLAGPAGAAAGAGEGG
jgi:dUTP pyrophosphatase